MPVILTPMINLVREASQCRTQAAGEFPAFLAVVAGVHPGDMLDQAEAGQFRAGPLERSPGDAVLLFEVAQGTD